MAAFTSLNSYDDLKRFIDSGLNDLLEQKKQLLLQGALTAAITKYTHRLAAWASQDVCYQFKREFQLEYQQLMVLAQDMNIRMEMDDSAELNSEMQLSASAVLRRDSDRTTTAFWGGAAAGAAIGSVIPVVGTLAGAFLGGLASFFFGPSLSDLKAQTRGSVQEAVRQYFDSLHQGALACFQKSANDYWNQIFAWMQMHKTQYTDVVYRMNLETRRQQEEVTAVLNKINRDMECITAKLDTIHRVRARLNSLDI